MEAKDIITELALEPLPEEGGYFREVYRSEGLIPEEVLADHNGPRNFSTSIYYFVTPEKFSSLHRVGSDEIFHFYKGDPVRMVQITLEGQVTQITLGSDLSRGEKVQVVVPRGVWQGTRLIAGGAWALMGCTVAPGFSFDDLEAWSREELAREFPQHRALIDQYTHR